MVVRKKKIIIEGHEMEVPVFDTKIAPGKEVDTDTLDNLSQEEEIEKEIEKAIERIRVIKSKYKNIIRNTHYFYEVGGVLQFVDKKDYYRKQRGKIWQRMARDLAPDLFLFDIQKEYQESKRYPEFMYLLYKVSRKFIENASWDQWYEIMKFKNIHKNQELLLKILEECKFRGPRSLRDRLHKLKDYK